jgi:hypothetical protein
VLSVLASANGFFDRVGDIGRTSVVDMRGRERRQNRGKGGGTDLDVFALRDEEVRVMKFS